MMMFKYDYTIYPDNNVSKFKETCSVIEEMFPNASKKDLLVDVDGSTIQVFNLDEKRIIVYDDYDVGAVYVKSDIRLENFSKAS